MGIDPARSKLLGVVGIVALATVIAIGVLGSRRARDPAPDPASPTRTPEDAHRTGLLEPFDEPMRDDGRCADETRSTVAPPIPVSTPRWGPVVEGRVIDEEGRNVGGAAIEIVRDGSHSTSLHADADGRFVLTLREPGVPATRDEVGLASAGTWIVATAAGFAPSAAVRVEGLALHDVVLRITRCGRIRGRLTDTHGVPAAGVRLCAGPGAFAPLAARELDGSTTRNWHGRAAEPRLVATTSSDGSFTFDAAWPDVAYDVVTGDVPLDDAAITLATDVRAGADDLHLWLPTDVHLELNGFDGAVTIEQYRAEDAEHFVWVRTLRKEADARDVVLRDLVPGMQYVFDLSTESGRRAIRGPMFVTPELDRSSYAPLPHGALEVTVHDEHGAALPGADVRVVRDDVPWTSGYHGSTGRDGRVRFEQVESFVWRVSARDDARRAASVVAQVRASFTTRVQLLLSSGGDAPR